MAQCGNDSLQDDARNISIRRFELLGSKAALNLHARNDTQLIKKPQCGSAQTHSPERVSLHGAAQPLCSDA